MPRRLHRHYGNGHLHFITSSCYHQRPLVGTAARRNLFLKIMEQVRLRYSFVVVGYVVMPEHVHLLISEPDRGTPSTVMQVLKQRLRTGCYRNCDGVNGPVRAACGRKPSQPDTFGSAASTTSWFAAKKRK